MALFYFKKSLVYCSLFPCLDLFMTHAAPSGPPQSVEHTILSPTSLRLTWDPPRIEHQNGAISSYHVQLNDTAGVRTVTGTSYTANNLRPGTIYGYRVAAFTVGLGPYSPWQYVRMTESRKYAKYSKPYLMCIRICSSRGSKECQSTTAKAHIHYCRLATASFGSTERGHHQLHSPHHPSGGVCLHPSHHGS